MLFDLPVPHSNGKRIVIEVDGERVTVKGTPHVTIEVPICMADQKVLFKGGDNIRKDDVLSICVSKSSLAHPGQVTIGLATEHSDSPLNPFLTINAPVIFSDELNVVAHKAADPGSSTIPLGKLQLKQF